MTTPAPLCSLSLDLDNLWSYMKTHGDVGWEAFPSYLDRVVPRALELLDRFGWKITFFLVGQDAAMDRNRAALASVAAAGHDIGNHSFHHEPWLHLYSRPQLEDEIARAEDAIEAVTGIRPRGFRGPGYSLSPTTLGVLGRRGYLYDASTLPTFLGPLARTYYFRKARLSDQQRRERGSLYGAARDGLQPLRPYRWHIDDLDILEIPVTTMPPLRLPFHFSYLLYICTFSPWLAVQYFKAALGMCRVANIEPSLLMHPLDFLGGDDIEELAFFPAMNLSSARKAAHLDRFLRILGSRNRVVPMSHHASELDRSSALSVRKPRAPRLAG